MRWGIRIHGDGMIARDTVKAMAIHTAVGDRMRYRGCSSHDEVKTKPWAERTSRAMRGRSQEKSGTTG